MNIELMSDERAAIKEMMECAGWKVARRIAEAAIEEARDWCETGTIGGQPDLRVLQGIARGYRNLLGMIEGYGKPESPRGKQENEIVERFRQGVTRRSAY